MSKPVFNKWYVENDGTLTYFVQKGDGFVGYTASPFQFLVLSFSNDEEFQLEKNQKLSEHPDAANRYSIKKLFETYS